MRRLLLAALWGNIDTVANAAMTESSIPPAAHLDAAQARPLRRPMCLRCGRPQRSCLCRWITPTEHAVAVLVLQHPDEQHHAKGSARLLQLSLAQCRCEVGERFDPEALAAWLHEPAAPGPAQAARRPLLLYPAAAPAASSEAPTGPGAPAPTVVEPAAWRLVVLDGTWRQAHRLLQAHPALQDLPRWPLPDPPPSRYAVRKARRAEQRSTLEATCLALGLLEGRAAHYQPLLAAFDGWVAAQLAWRANGPPLTICV